MPERLQINESNCIDFVAEITNHPFPHEMVFDGNIALVPQLHDDEVLRLVAETIPVDTPPSIYFDGNNVGSLFNPQSNWRIAEEYEVLPTALHFSLYERLADGYGTVVVGDYLGQKGKADIANSIRSTNASIRAVAATGALVGGGIALTKRGRVSRRRFLQVGSASLGFAALSYGGVAGASYWRQTKTIDDRCLSGGNNRDDDYLANKLARNVGGVVKHLNKTASNKHAIWGNAHLQRGIVERTQVELHDPRNTATNSMLLEAGFIKENAVADGELLLAQFVMDQTLSLDLEVRKTSTGRVILSPIRNSDGQFLTYHMGVSPEGLEKYNPLGSGGEVRVNAFMGYAHDVLQKV